MASFVEQGIFKIRDESSGPLSKINEALLKLERTAAKFGSKQLDIRVNTRGLDNAERKLETLIGKFRQLGSGGSFGGRGGALSLGNLNINTSGATTSLSNLERAARAATDAMRAMTASQKNGVWGGNGAGPDGGRGGRATPINHDIYTPSGAVRRAASGALGYTGARAAHASGHVPRSIGVSGLDYDQVERQLNARGFDREGEVEIDGHHVKGILTDIVKANAKRLSGKYQATSEREMMNQQNDAFALLGSMEHSIEVAEHGARFTQFMKSYSKPDEHGKIFDSHAIHKQIEAAVKSGELQGFATPEEFKDLYDTALVQVGVMGKTVDQGRLLTAQRRATAGVFQPLSQDFKTGPWAALVQENNETAGVMVRQVNKHIVGGKALSKKGEIPTAAKYDLLEMRDGRAGLKWHDEFRKDPDLWAKKVLTQIAAKEGIDLSTNADGTVKNKAELEKATDKLALILPRLMENSNANNFMNEVLTQWDKLAKERKIATDVRKRFEAGKFDEFFEGNTGSGAIGKFQAQFENIATLIGKRLVAGIVPYSDDITRGINKVGNAFDQHPLMATAGAATVGLAGVYASAKAYQAFTGNATGRFSSAVDRFAMAVGIGAKGSGGTMIPGGGLPGAPKSKGAIALKGLGILGTGLGVLGIGGSLMTGDFGSAAIDGGLLAAGLFGGPLGIAVATIGGIAQAVDAYFNGGKLFGAASNMINSLLGLKPANASEAGDKKTAAQSASDEALSATNALVREKQLELIAAQDAKVSKEKIAVLQKELLALVEQEKAAAQAKSVADAKAALAEQSVQAIETAMTAARSGALTDADIKRLSPTEQKKMDDVLDAEIEAAITKKDADKKAAAIATDMALSTQQKAQEDVNARLFTGGGMFANPMDRPVVSDDERRRFENAQQDAAQDAMMAREAALEAGRPTYAPAFGANGEMPDLSGPAADIAAGATDVTTGGADVVTGGADVVTGGADVVTGATSISASGTSFADAAKTIAQAAKDMVAAAAAMSNIHIDISGATAAPANTGGSGAPRR